jgi:hypothetical protein
MKQFSYGDIIPGNKTQCPTEHVQPITALATEPTEPGHGAPHIPSVIMDPMHALNADAHVTIT